MDNLKQWEITAREFTNCNCAYGCPCQFNALPTQGYCCGVVGFEIDQGHYANTKLDGLKAAVIISWPGPIHLGGGEAALVIDQRAQPEQREALVRILTGQDTEPGATIFQVFSTTFEKLHEPIYADIEFQVDIESRKANLSVANIIESRGEPILNSITGLEHRVRIDMPNGFEYTLAEAGRGWSKTTGPINLDLADSHGHFTVLHLCQSGVIH